MDNVDIMGYASKTKEVIRKAQVLIEDAKHTVAVMVCKEIIIPHLKEWGMSIRWRMGSVFANDKYGGDVEERDPRMEFLERKVEEVLEGIDIISNGYCNILWWVLCEQKFEAINLEQKPVDWYNNDSIPSICGRNIKFEDLDKGDYVYIVNYDSGEIEKAIVSGKPRRSRGMSKISFLNKGVSSITVNPTRVRSGNLFTNYNAAERSLERLFEKLTPHFNFYFKPEPEEIVRKLLA